MKSSIERIYYGNAGMDAVPITEEYRKLSNKISGKHEKILKSLSKKQRELFMEISDIGNMMSAEECFSSFKHGFELGLSLGLEIMLK